MEANSLHLSNLFQVPLPTTQAPQKKKKSYGLIEARR